MLAGSLTLMSCCGGSVEAEGGRPSFHFSSSVVVEPLTTESDMGLERINSLRTTETFQKDSVTLVIDIGFESTMLRLPGSWFQNVSVMFLKS